MIAVPMALLKFFASRKICPFDLNPHFFRKHKLIISLILQEKPTAIHTNNSQ